MLKKNLEAMHNDALKRRLEKLSVTESREGISYCVTPSKDYVLLKNNLPTDDLANPRKSINEMLNKNIKKEMKANDIIITFGIGLGYLLDEVYNKYSSRIYVYEPDLKLLHFVLSNADLSIHLSNERVFITNDLTELTNKLSSSYLSHDKVEIVYLPNYAIIKNKEMLMLTQKVLDTCKSKIVDINTISKFSQVWLKNTIYNISAINNKPLYQLSSLENKFIGQTAVIIGAGPSLAENISLIKERREKCVIFAVNKVVKYLLENNIVPDFVVCLDANNMQKTLGDITGNLANSCCIMDIRSDCFLPNIAFKKIFVNFSESDFFIKKLATYNDFIKPYGSGGTATILALISAVKLGFSKVVLTGVDLAFKNEILYANGEKLERISPNEIMADSVKKNIVQVQSVDGSMVNTRDDYKAFIQHFETTIKDLKYEPIYNTTSFGANLEGTKNVEFSAINMPVTAHTNAINNVEPFKLNISQFVKEECEHINDIISILSNGIFSQALVSTIIKSAFVYQYMQADILQVLQKDFDPSLADSFIEKTKQSIKTIVELLQNNNLL